MRVLVVTAANDNFMPLLYGLLNSLHALRTKPFTDIAVLDVGLSPPNRAWVANAARHIAEPGWDLPYYDDLRALNPSNRAKTARPFLPQYFPGYDIYLWLDADTWVQEPFALEACIEAAKTGGLAAVPHNHPSYSQTSEIVQWRKDTIRDYFGDAAAERGQWDAYLNSGVFALAADAPHWGLWAKWFGIGLQTSRRRQCTDQTALNHTVWHENLPVTQLPAICNWMCHLALPYFDAKRWRFCEPSGERRTIGVLHLVGTMKNLKVTIDVKGVNGPQSLRYPGPLRS